MRMGNLLDDESAGKWRKANEYWRDGERAREERG